MGGEFPEYLIKGVVELRMLFVAFLQNTINVPAHQFEIQN